MLPSLRLVQFFADQGGAFEADLHGGMAAALKPLHQAGDLGGAPGAVGPFHHNELAGEFGQIHARNAMPVKMAGLSLGHDDAARDCS